MSDRIRFRLCVLAYRCLHGTAPACIAESLRLSSTIEGLRLRSTDAVDLFVPVTRCRTIRTNINPLLLLLRNASTPLSLPPPLHPRKLWNFINTLVEGKPTHLLPPQAYSQSLSQMFATFFSDKIHKLHTALKYSSTVSSPHIPSKNTPTTLSFFSLVSEDEVSKIISQLSNSFSDLDPIHTSLLKRCLSALLPTLNNINLSLAPGTFPDQLKSCYVIPLLK